MRNKIGLLLVAILLVGSMIIYLLPPTLFGFSEKSQWNPDALHISEDGGMYISDAGTLYSWGAAQYGLASNIKNFNLFCKKLMENVKEIALPIDGPLVLKDNGELWACSKDAGAAVFLDETPSSNKYKVLDDVVSIDARGWRSYAVQADGSLWGWGTWYGENSSDKEASLLMKNAASVHCVEDQLYVVITKEQDAYLGGHFYQNTIDTPMYIASGVVEVSGCGNGSFLLLDTDGIAYRYQVNDQLEIAKIDIVSQDVSHLAGCGFLKNDGTLWSYNNYVDKMTTPHQVADNIVSANCHVSEVNYIQEGVIYSVNLKGEIIQKLSVYDFAPNRLWILKFCIWKWL